MELGEVGPPLVAMLAGGLVASVGAMAYTRTTRGQATLLRVKGRWLAIFSIAVVAGAGVAVYGLSRSFLDASRDPGRVASPAQLLAFGLLVGLALSLPGVAMSWSDARARDRTRRKLRDSVPTKDDRRAFAEDLERRILDVSDRPRALTASVGGDGGRILRLDGDIDAREGERLTAALRTDLKDLGFKRVEGNRGKAWWTRV